MLTNRRVAEKADIRQRARECLERAKMQALNADSLRYSCLELRFCIEFLVIGRLQAYLDEVGDEALKKWTPKDIMTEILAVDPHGDKSIAVSLGIRSPSGAPMAVLTPLGDDRRFDMRWANKSYNTLVNFLHAPTLEQLEMGKGPDAKVVQKRIATIVDELEAVLASPIYNVSFGNFFQLKCECCGTDIKRRADSIPASGVICPNRNCRAVYDVKKGLSEFLCARRYDLTPTGQDRVYPADGLPGKLVVLDNRGSLVRSKHLFLRPDLPSLRQARASRVKSAAQRRDRSHAQPPLGGEHGEDPRFDAAEHDASLGQGGVS